MENTKVNICSDQIDRVVLTGIKMSSEQQKKYIDSPDDLGEFVAGMEIPVGYKKCGRCQHILKFYLFNRNSGSKTNTTGNCKACQKDTAAKSYGKTKKKRNYKKYYAEHKEEKQVASKKYYAQNKDEVLKRQKRYHDSAAGKKVMQLSHQKRRDSLAANKGIPYSREMIIDRDCRGKKLPVCYICHEPIKDTSGAGLHLDHVIPVVLGGLDCFTNIASVHEACNLTKKKDGSDVTAKQIQEIKDLSYDYMDNHPDKFEEAK